MSMVFREYFIGGPLNGKDKREEYPAIRDFDTIIYTDGEETYKYGAMLVHVFDYVLRVWIDHRHGSPELDKLRIAEMLMSPHAVSVPDVTVPDIPPPNVQPGGMVQHQFRVRMDGQKSSVLVYLERHADVDNEWGWGKPRSVGHHLVMVADAEDVPDYLDIMADLVTWEVITGPYCGHYEGQCVRVSDGTAEYVGIPVTVPETAGEGPAPDGEGESPEDQPDPGKRARGDDD